MDAVKKTESVDNKLHFLDYWRIIRIRKIIILVVFLLVVVTTVAVTMVMKQTFDSTVRIAVEKDTTDIQLLGGMGNSGAFDPYFIQTEFEKIQSKSILHKVIEQLDLNNKWAKRYNDGTPLKTEETYLFLSRSINVSQSRNTSLIEIRVFSEDKNEAALIANTIAEVYRESRLSIRQQMSQRGIEALKAELEETNKKVREKQEEVDSERVKNNISDAMAESGMFGSMLEPETVRRMESERISAKSLYVELKSTLDSLTSKKGTALRQAISVAIPDALLPGLLEKLSDTQQRLASISKDLGEEHPDVKRLTELQAQIDQDIDLRIKGILEGLTVKVEAVQDRIKSLEEEVAKAKEQDVKSAENYRPYLVAKRELENLQKIRDAILLRSLQETVDAKIPRTTIVEITDKAEPGFKPVRPNVKLNIGLGIVFGLVLGVGLAFFIEYLDTSVKTIDDVERALQAPVMGVIPQNVGPLINEGLDSPHAEAYRVLRTNVLFTRKDENFRTMTVVSGGAGEGKSTTIFNLATIFAQNGSRVLIVDSDLRRPSLHKILGVSNAIGLTNYLLRQNTLEEVVQTTKVPTLDFLPSGKLPSSSMGILNSTQMKEFMAEAKRRYDFVFFDSPPIMGVSDASVLASEVDLCLLVIQYRKYPQAMTIRAKQMVEKVGGRLMGVVLNNINISQDSYYYYYSGYYYDYYSKHDDDDDTGDTGKKNGEAKKASGERAQVDLKKKY